MDNSTIIIIIILFILFIAVSIAIALVSSYLSKKRLEEIVSEFGLVQGAQYNVTNNNGNRVLNLTYDHIAYGNKSQNGNINIYFIKNSKYRGTLTQKEVMIKYGNIRNIDRIDASTSYGASPKDFNEDFGNEYDEYGGYPEPIEITEKHYKNNTHIPENQNGKELIETNEPRVKEKKGYPSLKYYYRCFKPIKPESLSYGEHPIHGLHVRYYIAIRELYKDRAIPSALQHVIELCQLDIELVCKYGTDPTYGYLNFESFKRLIIIYEKEKRFDECIELCNRALEVMDKNQANTFNIHYGIHIRNKLEALKKKAS